jgi:hypothetical protein
MSKKSTSKVRTKKAGAIELELSEINLSVAQLYRDMLFANSPEEYEERSQRLFELEAQAIEMQSQIISTSGSATDQQAQQIDDAFSAEISVLNQDLLEFGGLAQEQASAEFRARGLDPGRAHSVGVDRSNDIAQELMRQQAKGATALRGQGALLKSTFNKPTFAGLVGNIGAGLGTAGALGGATTGVAGQELAGLRGIRGLNTKTTSIMSGQQQASMITQDMAANVSAAGSLMGGMGGMMSSRSFKEDKKDVDTRSLLKLIQNLEVQRWKYLGEDTEHIGPYAEDFQEAFGLGNSDKTIDVVDAVGVLFAGIKELSDRLDHEEAMRRAA